MLRLSMTNAGGLVRNVFTLGAAQVVTWIGAAVLAVVLPRFLGDVGLGKFAFAFALTRLVGLLADLGSTTFLAKEVAKDPAGAGKLVGAALTMRFPLSTASAALAIAMVAGARDEITRGVVYVFALGILFDGVNGILLGALQGLQKMRALGLASVASKLGFALFATIALLRGGGPIEVAAAWVVGQMLGLAIEVKGLGRLDGLRLTPDFRIWRVVLLGGMPFFVWQAALLVYGQIDAVLLSVLTADEVVGWYSAAYRVVTLPIFIPAILMTVMLPALSSAARSPERFNRLVQRSIQLVALLTIPMALGILLLADRIIALLGYPIGFVNSIVPIIVLAPSLPIVAVDMMIGTALAAADRQRRWAIAGVIAAVLNPLANVVVIPFAQRAYSNGAIGAAAVTTATELFMLVVGVWLLPRHAMTSVVVAYIGRSLAAAALMAAAVVATRDLPLAIPVTVGGAVYAASALALRMVARSEVTDILRILTTQRAGIARSEP